jgi:hypothetical protein
MARTREKTKGLSASEPKKSPGLVVNKAAEIRRVAGVLVAEGELPRPKTIRERLGRKGIVVTSQQVSMALTDTEFAYRRNQVDRAHPEIEVSLEDVVNAKKFVEQMGSVEKAMASIAAFGKYPEAKSIQAPTEEVGGNETTPYAAIVENA